MEIVFEPVPERGPVSNYDIVRRMDAYEMAAFLTLISDSGPGDFEKNLNWLQSPFVRREQDG